MIGNLAAKYDIQIEAPEEQTETPIESYVQQQRIVEPLSAPWREYPRVVALSDFLRQHQDHGIRIVRQDNRPLMHFEPPLDHEDKERMDIAGQALELFALAFNDIEFLMHRGLISIENHPGYH